MDQSAELNRRLRALPSIEQLLSAPLLADAAAQWRRDLLKRLAQAEVAQARAALESGAALEAGLDALAQRVLGRLAELDSAVLRPVVNATGVVLHTNLGRAVLSPRAQAAVAAVAPGHCNLEVDLATGRRTRRDAELEPLLAALLGLGPQQGATVVNNCAAAVLLCLHTLARGREVVTSRGELVEIGGSYRVPEVAAASGCTLVEVGSTNRTRIADYAAAVGPRTALLLKTHPSNFRIRGFTEEAGIEALGQLARERGLPLVADLGSGWIPPAGTSPQLDEPAVAEALADGASLALFSGDKLLGGPQAGIIVGDAALIRQLRDSPLWRALRIDKLTAAALGATLLDHLRGTLPPSHPASVLERAEASALQSRADELVQALREARPDWKLEVRAAPGSWGGGSLPDEEIASLAVVVDGGGKADALLAGLRLSEPAVAAYILGGRPAFNVLTLLEGDSARIAAAAARLP